MILVELAILALANLLWIWGFGAVGCFRRFHKLWGVAGVVGGFYLEARMLFAMVHS